MLENAKRIIQDSYAQLLAVFVVVVFLVSIGVLPDWRVNFLLFSIVLGVFGWTLIDSRKSVSIPSWLLWVAVSFALLTRIIPYIHNAVPLGYDPGWHKFPFEHPFTDSWPKAVFPLPFLLLMSGITHLTSAWFALVPLFVLFSAVTALVVYFVTKKFFDKSTALIAALLFAVSISQFETFWYNYYKNVLGIIILLIALLFVTDNKRLNWKLILVGGLVMGIHQPAFFIFGLTYFFYTMKDIAAWRSVEFRNAVLNGILIIAVAFLINFDRVYEIIIQQFIWTVSSFVDSSGGSFFDASTYLLYTVPFIPFAITGFYHSWRKNLPLAIAGAVCTAVVVFSLFFHNRMIIYLDIFVIIYAAVGLIVLMQNKPFLGRTVLVLFIVLSGVLLFIHASQAKPLISTAELQDIESLNTRLEPNATIMSTDKYYSTWLKGYSGRNVIAPGLFDDQRMNYTDWVAFWTDVNRQRYIDQYSLPLYIHVGQKQPQYNFSDVCTPEQFETMTLYRCA